MEQPRHNGLLFSRRNRRAGKGGLVQIKKTDGDEKRSAKAIPTKACCLRICMRYGVQQIMREFTVSKHHQTEHDGNSVHRGTNH